MTATADIPTHSAPPLVVARNLNVRFQLLSRARALRDVSFEIPPGEILCVIGPNGAGKTTLLNLLAGCLFKTRNRITIAGLDRWKNNYEVRRLSTYVPMGQYVPLGPTPLDHMTNMARLYEMPEADFARRCAALVDDMNYHKLLHKYWGQLSLGQYHKALLIGGFLPPARLRILDEPIASGIDPLGMEILGVWMKECRAAGESIVFSTQVLDRAHLLADRLLILHNGSIGFLGTPAQFIEENGLDADDDYALNRAFAQRFGGTP